jgi:D-3-phosphoglycerate dehydrogenase
MTKILCTCPPMIRAIDSLKDELARRGAEVVCPEFKQTLSVGELLKLVPQHDGWIIGDDPATAEVFRAGKDGRLRAAVKWGAGTDNVDFAGAVDCGFNVVNTPGTFGEEVSDVAIAYLIGLARDLFFVDREVRNGKWPKPPGTSLEGKTVGVVGYGHIGRATARKLNALGMTVVVYDPIVSTASVESATLAQWPEKLGELDFLILACALTDKNKHMLDAGVFDRMRCGIRIINVSRGGLINQAALRHALDSGRVAGAALEVFEEEPPGSDEPLLRHPHCIFGSHNSSNTLEAVLRTSMTAIELLFERLSAANRNK